MANHTHTEDTPILRALAAWTEAEETAATAYAAYCETSRRVQDLQIQLATAEAMASIAATVHTDACRTVDSTYATFEAERGLERLAFEMGAEDAASGEPAEMDFSHPELGDWRQNDDGTVERI